MKVLVILIPKWAHPAPKSIRFNFYARSKSGPTRAKWPKIGEKVDFTKEKSHFQKS